MCFRLIGSTYNIAFFVSVKYCMNFIPVIKRVIHSNDRFDISELSKKLLHFFLLGHKLFFVRNPLILTASAFL